MGFSLKKIGVGVATGGLSLLGDLTKANAPTLPGVPNPYLYDAAPDFTNEEKQYIQQRRDLLSQATNRLNAAPTAYDQSNNELAALEQAKYKQALTQQQGTLNAQQQQARADEYQKLVEQAGRRGIRINGDDPSTATSNSTAGNQILLDFNKRYDALADNQRQADLNFGYTANTGRLGLVNQANQNYFANNATVANQAAGIQGVYGDQRAAKYNVGVANTDIRNGFLTNTYNQQTNQATLNANASNQTNSNRLGLVNSIIQGGAAFASGGASSAGTAAKGRMGFQPYTGTPGPYAPGQ